MDELFLDFLNTAWYIRHDAHADPLCGSAWVKGVLEREKAVPLTAYEGERLIGLREALTAAADQLIETGGLDDCQLAWLNGRLWEYPVCYHLAREGDEFRLTDQPQQDGLEYTEYLVLKSFAAFVASGLWRILRRCGNADCRWFFVDHSKSHTRKWCGNTCASLFKVRRHRANKST